MSNSEPKISPKYAQLLDLIQYEISLGLQLQDRLSQERKYLESQDLLQLQQLLCDKAELLAEIETVREKRTHFLSASGIALSPEDLENHLLQSAEPMASSCAESLNACEEVFNLASKYNELNGLLIVSSRKRNLRRLDIFKGISETQKIYDSQGQTALAGPTQARKLA